MGGGAGTRLMQTAVQESLFQGFGGRIKLTAVEDAVSFYEKLNPSLVQATNSGRYSQFSWNRVDALALLLR
jgi:hypothetical protein